MHQHPRPSPKVASPASSPRTNPTRTNNPRDEIRSQHSRPPSEVPMYSEPDEPGTSAEMKSNAPSGPSPETHKKLDQIIQNFHTKAAIVILQSRMSLPPVITREGTRKTNKWFQIETDDTDSFRDELKIWKTCGGFENRPPPLIVETYLDTSNLTNNQSVVIVDENGKRWDVLEALNGSNEGNLRERKARTEVVLERWRIELKQGTEDQTHDFGSVLPTTYKKSIVFFRSLYATSKFVPAWRFSRNLAKSSLSNGSMRVKCRIIDGSETVSSHQDPLTHPLYESDNPVVTTFSLGETDSPAGRFSAELCYRNDCNFRVDDSETLLSSRFMGADEQFFQPSLDGKHNPRRQTAKTAEVGSLPSHRKTLEDLEPIQAYGSLSTFHGNAPPLGSSPISALRAAQIPGSDTSSPPTSLSFRSRPTQPARPTSSRAIDGIEMARRPSLSFQPFKAGSLSASPVPSMGDMLPPQSPRSLSRTSGISALAQARNRSSLTAGMPASLRGAPILPENAIASSASSSPKPAPISRYSSSFSHRRGKLSYGGASRVDDDQGSSGKQSLSSSAQPGSGILAEGGPGGSSGSLQTDDDNISDFLKMLDSKKTLSSFEPSRAGEASAKRTSAQLSRFQLMRESNNALTESMTSSTLMHRSSSSSIRQPSSLPPMVAATSTSTSSSPGKPVSPHTPHTPAVPSRLSIAENNPPRRVSQRTRTAPETQVSDHSDDEDNGGIGTIAIDIPISPRPRPYYPHTRRSSSVAQQHRSVAVDDDVGDLQFGVNRSVSLGAEDRAQPSLNSLLGLEQGSERAAETATRQRSLQSTPHHGESSTALARQFSRSNEQEEARQVPKGLTPGSSKAPYRPTIGGRVGGKGTTPPTGSYSSLPTDRGSGSGHSDRPGSRYRPGAYEVEDEPLLFDMSEIGRDQSRRSLEDSHGVGNSAGTSERPGFDGARGGDSGSSSRRGSRRGW